jgi:hypothetical protein
MGSPRYRGWLLLGGSNPIRTYADKYRADSKWFPPMKTCVMGQALDKLIVTNPSDDRYTAEDSQHAQDKTNDHPSPVGVFGGCQRARRLTTDTWI